MQWRMSKLEVLTTDKFSTNRMLYRGHTSSWICVRLIPIMILTWKCNRIKVEKRLDRWRNLIVSPWLSWPDFFQPRDRAFGRWRTNIRKRAASVEMNYDKIYEMKGGAIVEVVLELWDWENDSITFSSGNCWKLYGLCEASWRRS